MKTLYLLFISFVLCSVSWQLFAVPDLGKPKYFVAIDSNLVPKYSKNFSHFEYVDPNAKKGGTVTLSANGSFNSFNPFTAKGNVAIGMGNVYDSLMTPSEDEQSVQYLNLASAIFYDDSKTWVAFQINPQARWHDNKKITADDAIWTFNTLTTKGAPIYRFYYQDVKKVSKLPGNIVYFNFKKENQEMPYILGQLLILPKHYWEDKDFASSNLMPPLGSGPYKVGKVIPGSSVRFERVPNYWGKDLPVNIGRFNPNSYVHEYYRDQNVIREALKGGKVDYFVENSAKEWEKSYNIKAVKEKKLIKEKIVDHQPSGLQALVFNTRRSIFKNPVVRSAINHAFDFEWTNKTFFYDNYIRANSYYNNSEFAARKLPSPEELEILNSLKGKIPSEVFTKVYEPPQTDGSGRPRKNLRTAKQMLEKEGWKVKNGVLTNQKTGEVLKFEILTYLQSFDRILNPFVKNLKLLGIQAEFVLVNPDNFVNRIRKFDFDMILGGFGQSSSPGNEQWEFWGSAAADKPGSRNQIGIKDPAVDQVIELITSAKKRKDLITRVRVLDRILLWNHFVIPLYYYPYHRVLYRNKFSKPKIAPKYGTGIGFDTWWVDPKKETVL